MEPHEVIAEIQRLQQALVSKTHKLAVNLTKAGEAKVAYRIAYAGALLEAEGSVAQREAEATLACAEQLTAMEMTAAVADASRESVRSIRDALNAAQSVSSMLKEQMRLGG